MTTRTKVEEIISRFFSGPRKTTYQPLFERTALGELVSDRLPTQNLRNPAETLDRRGRGFALR